MTENFNATLYEFRGSCSIAAPLSWELTSSKYALDLVNEDPTADRRSTMNIKIFENPDAVINDMQAAVELANDFAKNADWQIDDEDIGEFWIDDIAVATFTVMAHKDTSGAPLPRPVLWQVWILMGNGRFASIKHRIDDPVDGVKTWKLGDPIVRTFRWKNT